MKIIINRINYLIDGKLIIDISHTKSHHQPRPIFLINSAISSCFFFFFIASQINWITSSLLASFATLCSKTYPLSKNMPIIVI